MKQSHLWLVGALILGVPVFALPSAAAIAATIIDDFEQGTFSIQDDASFGSISTSQSGLGSPGSLGGTRAALVEVNSASGLARFSLATDGPGGQDDGIVLSVDPLVSAHARVTLLDVAPSAAYDLTAHGNAVRVVIEQAPSFGDVVLSFTDAQGRTRGLAMNISTSGDRYWAMQTGPNFNYAAVTKLVLSMNVIGTGTPRDYRISDVSIVPEPVALCPMLVMAMLMRRRRRIGPGRRIVPVGRARFGAGPAGDRQSVR